MWTFITPILASAVTLFLGLLTYLRSSKQEDVVNTAATIQSTYDGQQRLVENLQKEVQTLSAKLKDCQDSHQGVWEELRKAYAENLKLTEEMNDLKGTVGEHEDTIAKHEREISSLRARKRA